MEGHKLNDEMKRNTILSALMLLTLGLTTKATAQTANEVYLDDREDRSWSYYSDPTCLIRSLNPADVKITYFGHGTATMYSSSSATPTGSPDQNVGAAQVGIGIDAPGKNTYVYHKTLECVNGKQAASMAAADGPCSYTTIPNPFSLRPTHGTGETRWRGFYKWRLKSVSGGAVYADAAMGSVVAQGAMVDAEQELFLAPAAETGMAVEFEAIWARAFVFPSVASLNSAEEGNLATGTNAYECNFIIISHLASDGGSSYSSAQHPVTFSAVYPDGTDGSNASRLTAVPTTVWFSQSYECQADTRFEYLIIQSPDNTLQINGDPATATAHQDNPLIHSRVYCGGYQGAYNSTSHIFQVTTYNGLIKGSVYGGGHGVNAITTGNTNVQILGFSRIEKNVYGGGNMGTVTGDTRVVIGGDNLTYTITVASNNDAMGSVTGGGVYQIYASVSVRAVPIYGYRFKRWTDGNTYNPRPVIVLGDATYTALFELIPVEWVDLGLPSGLLWTAYNLGADSPEGYGNYYAWGETTTKEDYSWNTYVHGAPLHFTKYCNNSASGLNGYTDNLTTLEPEDDVARAVFGGDAHIPTGPEWNELLVNTTQTVETLNGVEGRRFTSRNNSNSIFIPFGGSMNSTIHTDAGTKGILWTATYGTFESSTAMILYMTNSEACRISNGSRFYGLNIRAVRSGE